MFSGTTFVVSIDDVVSRVALSSAVLSTGSSVTVVDGSCLLVAIDDDTSSVTAMDVARVLSSDLGILGLLAVTNLSSSPLVL